MCVRAVCCVCVLLQTQKFEDVVIVHINEWQAKIVEAQVCVAPVLLVAAALLFVKRLIIRLLACFACLFGCFYLIYGWFACSLLVGGVCFNIASLFPVAGDVQGLGSCSCEVRPLQGEG